MKYKFVEHKKSDVGTYQYHLKFTLVRVLGGSEAEVRRLGLFVYCYLISPPPLA
ncbi:hypothetical protein LP109_05410 [Moraxella bovis]|uniref:hypothetical protein n=1 Tax=Moraxella bovis TaxID=476 RepID=UPI00130131AF|nr:hypothetical protein [Moraxella bovis]UZA17720.1 hypothetical protein LP109_05410 [Moraxella bovis]